MATIFRISLLNFLNCFKCSFKKDGSSAFLYEHGAFVCMRWRVFLIILHYPAMSEPRMRFQFHKTVIRKKILRIFTKCRPWPVSYVAIASRLVVSTFSPVERPQEGNNLTLSTMHHRFILQRLPSSPLWQSCMLVNQSML